MQITDPQAIRALAHPVRLDLLETLAAGGPATAAECGRALGVSQASCSFHLRQLARYGFVDDAGPGEDRRERRYRLRATPTTVQAAAGSDAVRRQLERLVIEREAKAAIDYLPQRASENRPWRAATGGIASVIIVDAREAADLKRAWRELLEPYIARSASAPQPGQRAVRYFMTATPMTSDGGDNG
jgi:DNA-binding transcriptional ArsR family regulator